MRRLGAAVVALTLAATAGVALAADPATAEKAPLYTNDDLDRMFGPAPPQPSEPVDKTTPEDWRWVEQFLDRQYARVDADRRWDLDRRALDVAEQRTPIGYGGNYAAWNLGYPASTWWNNVWWRYAAATGGHRAPVVGPSPYAWTMGEMNRGHAAPRGRTSPRGGGHGSPGSHGPANAHGAKSR